jgi:hypothetical protein
VLALGVGCKSEEHHSARSGSADTAISNAENSGAEESSSEYLRTANKSREEANKIDTEVTDERNAANADLEKAQKRMKKAEVDRTQVDTELTEARKLREEQAKTLATAPDAERSFAKARLDATDSSIVVLEERRKLCDCEAKDADLSMKSSQAMIESADQRSKLGTALYTKAERHAHAAEAEKTQKSVHETPMSTPEEKPVETKPTETPSKTD